MRLIDADALENQFGVSDEDLLALDEIRHAPTVDAVPVVHGRWTAQCVVELDGGWTLEDVPYNEYQHSNPICSVCRKTALLDGGEDYVTSPYCPNCGAKMDEKEAVYD